MDIYFEQNVENPKIDARQKKHKILAIVRYVLLGIGIVLGYILFMNVMMTDLSSGVMPVIIQAVISVLILVPFVLIFIFLGRYLNNSNIEYDYVITDGIFRIVKVINRKKRKKMLEFNLSGIESIGKIQSETYDRYAGAKDIKKIFAICNYEDEEAIVYIYFGNDGSKQLLHIEPNDDMIMSLKRCVSRISIIDKSLKLSATQSSTKDMSEKSKASLKTELYSQNVKPQENITDKGNENK